MKAKPFHVGCVNWWRSQGTRSSKPNTWARLITRPVPPMIQNMSKPRRASSDIRRSLPVGGRGPEGWGERGLAGVAVAMKETSQKTSLGKGRDTNPTESVASIIMDGRRLGKHLPRGECGNGLRPPSHARVAGGHARRVRVCRKSPRLRGSHSERSEESTQNPVGTKRSFAALRMTFAALRMTFAALRMPTGLFRQSRGRPRSCGDWNHRDPAADDACRPPQAGRPENAVLRADRTWATCTFRRNQTIF